MKFEMSSSEFATFSAALALAEVTKLNQAHTSELESLQAEVREARHERNEAWDKIDTLRDEIRSLEHSRDSAGYETSRLRSEVQTLLARLHNLEEMVPNRKERDFSEMFELFRNPSNKIAVIKKLREIEGVGLKEAKDTVEGIFKGPNLNRLVVLSNVFGAFQHATPTHLAELLKPVVKSDATEAELLSILAGTFHKPAPALIAAE